MNRNEAGQSIGAQLVSANDGGAFTGTVTVYVTIDRGTQAIGTVGSGVCAHEGNGYHTYAPAQAETDGAQIGFTFIGTNAVPVSHTIYPFDWEAFFAEVEASVLAALGDYAVPTLNEIPLATEIADVWAVRDWLATIAAVGQPAARSNLNAMRLLRNRWLVATGVLSVKREDDVAEAWNAPVSTDAAAEPITGIDPS